MTTCRATLFAFVAAALLCGYVSAGPQQEIKVSVSISRDSIGMDEQAVLMITVSGPNQNLPRPSIPTLAAFEMYSQGTSSELSITNGKVSASMTYRYLLFPQKAGTFPINNIAVVHNNRRYKGNGVQLTVISSGVSASPKLEQKAQSTGGKSKDYFLEAIVDKRKPYVNEQVTLTLKFYIAVQYYGSPELAEPTTTGFWTELLGNKAPYYQKINNRTYKVIERKYALFPTQTGELTVGRATIKATIASRRRRRTDGLFGGIDDFFGRGKEVSTSSQPIRVAVRPLPAEGRPSDFTGTIGNFSISSSVNRNEVEVNQPVSLTIRISGTGNIKSVAEPTIPELDEFRIYRASSSENSSTLNDKVGGTKVYEEVFIPKRPGKLSIPALSFNYFDPDKQKYFVITTKPIGLRVTKPEGYVAGGETPYGAPDFSIGSEARDIRYIKSEPGKLQPMGQLVIFSPLYIAVNGVPVVLLAGVMVYRRRRDRLAGDKGLARSRAAVRAAQKRLARARSLAESGQVEECYAEVTSAVISFIADKLNISPHGLTVDRIAQLLSDKGADEQLVNDIVGLMREADFARYAPGESAGDDLGRSVEQAQQLMVRLTDVRFV